MARSSHARFGGAVARSKGVCTTSPSCDCVPVPEFSRVRSEVGPAPSLRAELALQHLVELLLALRGLLVVIIEDLLLAEPGDLFLLRVA